MLLVISFMISVATSCNSNVISPTTVTTTITNTDQFFNCYGNGGIDCNFGGYNNDSPYSIRSGDPNTGVNYAESDYCFSNTQSITTITFKYQYTWWDQHATTTPANPATLTLILKTDSDQEIWASNSFTPPANPSYEWEGCGCDGCYCAFSPLQSTSFSGLNLDISGNNVHFIIKFTNLDSNIHLMKSTLQFIVTWETLNPTTSPSKYPSQSPSKYPSITPTNNPSKYPTKFPSQSPSKYPSYSPTKQSINPTISSNNPTMSSNTPTHTPSIQAPNDNDSAAQVETQPITTSDIGGMKANTEDNSSEFDLYLIYIITACALLFICCVLGVFIYKKKRNQKQTMENTLENTVSVVEMNTIPATMINSDTNIVTNGEEDIEEKASEGNVQTIKHVNTNSDELWEDKAGNICHDQTSGMITNGGDGTDIGHTTRGNITLSEINETDNDLLEESINSDHDMNDIIMDNDHITATDGNNEQNEDLLLDGMLSDIMKMDDLDPNKIHENNMKNLMHKQNNDSDDSNNMYET